MRLIKNAFTARFRRGVVCALLAAVFAFSSVISGTLAWTSIFQSATNAIAGEYERKTEVELHKKDKQTGAAISGAEFYLYMITETGDVQVGGRYLTDGDGMIKVALPPGDYYFIETDPGENYTYDTDGGGNIINIYPFSVTGEEQETIVITAYNVLIPGRLVIAKFIVNTDHSGLTGDQLEIEFEFTVTFYDSGGNVDGGVYTYRIDGGVAQTLTSGGTLRLKHGQQAVFEDLPIGFTYTVSEQAASGYTPVPSAYSGPVTGEGALLSFVNLFDPEPDEPGSLLIRKTVSASPIDPHTGTLFEFNIDLTLPEGTELPLTVLVNGEPRVLTELVSQLTESISHGGSLLIEGLPAGTAYRVTETAHSDYTSTISSVTGTIASGHTAEIGFVNVFTGRVTVDITGEKTWKSDGSPALPASITVRLKNGSTVVETVVVTPGADGRWRYSFTAPKYDGMGNEIIYTVDEEPVAGWKPAVTGYNIENIHIRPVVTETPAVRKVVQGSPPAALKFGFRLTALGGAPMPDGASGSSKTIYITGAGENSFGEITFTTPGTYVYTIAEINTGESGYTFDGSVYTLTIVVTEEGGELVISSKTLTKDGVGANKATFTNIYSPGKPDPGKPDPGKPDPGKPDPGKPGGDDPDPGKPDPGKPGGDKPASGQKSGGDDPAPGKKPGEPKTGDSTNFWLWFTLMVLSMSGMVVIWKKWFSYRPKYLKKR